MINNKNIIVGIDFSESSLEVLKKAFKLAKLENAELTIVHAIDKSLFEMYFSSSDNNELLEKAKTKITEEIKKYKDDSVKYSLIVEISSPSELIINTAKNIKADLLIIGVNSEANFKTKIFGSTSIKTIQNSNLPVLIVKNYSKDEYKNILAFTDLSTISAKSINFSQDFFSNSSIKVVYAYKQLTDFVLTFYNSLTEKEKIQNKVNTEAVSKFENFKKENNIQDGEIIEVYHGLNKVLVDKADNENTNLVVIGSNGVKDSGSFLYGSVALYMIENVQSDILVYVPKKD